MGRWILPDLAKRFGASGCANDLYGFFKWAMPSFGNANETELVNRPKMPVFVKFHGYMGSSR